MEVQNTQLCALARQLESCCRKNVTKKAKNSHCQDIGFYLMEWLNGDELTPLRKDTLSGMFGLPWSLSRLHKLSAY